jgi:hypothetical protein
MAAMKEEYVKFVLASYMRTGIFDEQVGNSWIFDDNYQALARSTVNLAFEQFDISVDPQYYEDNFAELFDLLVKDNAVIYEGDEYTEQFFRFNSVKKNKVVEQILQTNSVARRIERLGEAGPEALRRALNKIVGEGIELYSGLDMQADNDPIGSISVPAADRIVAINHNQRSDIDDAASQVIANLTPENSIDGDSDLRDRFLAQLSAGRELIRAQSIRAYLLYEVWARMLSTLIARYKDQAIGEAAKKLLGLLIEHIFGK